VRQTEHHGEDRDPEDGGAYESQTENTHKKADGES
jgi:hypothetical protein